MLPLRCRIVGSVRTSSTAHSWRDRAQHTLYSGFACECEQHMCTDCVYSLRSMDLRAAGLCALLLLLLSSCLLSGADEEHCAVLVPRAPLLPLHCVCSLCALLPSVATAALHCGALQSSVALKARNGAQAMSVSMQQCMQQCTCHARDAAARLFYATLCSPGAPRLSPSPFW